MTFRRTWLTVALLVLGSLSARAEQIEFLSYQATVRGTATVLIESRSFGSSSDEVVYSYSGPATLSFGFEVCPDTGTSIFMNGTGNYSIQAGSRSVGDTFGDSGASWGGNSPVGTPSDYFYSSLDYAGPGGVHQFTFDMTDPGGGFYETGILGEGSTITLSRYSAFSIDFNEFQRVSYQFSATVGPPAIVPEPPSALLLGLAAVPLLLGSILTRTADRTGAGRGYCPPAPEAIAP